MKQIRGLLLLAGVLSCLSVPLSPLWGINVIVNQSTFVLSNEGNGLITQLVNAGYGEYNLYDALVAIQANTDPSVAGLLTPAFLATLQNCPAGAEIFTTRLKTVTSHGVSVSISTDGSARYDNVLGATYYNSFPTLAANISGVGPARFTHSTTSSAPLNATVIQGPLAGMTTTYNAFGVAWAGPPVPPPTLVSLAPAVTTGTSQSLTVTYNAPGGYQSLDVVNVLINNFLDGRQACPAFSRSSWISASASQGPRCAARSRTVQSGST